jgi:ABC-type multidrug transport system fused ATPase/permease subunit
MTALKRLLRHLRPYWRGLGIATFLILFKTLIGLLPPLFQRSIIDNVIGQKQLQLLLPLLGGLLIVYLFTMFADFGDQYLRHTIGERILFDLRVRLYDHLQRLSLSFFERTSTGELMSRASNDVNALEQFMTHSDPNLALHAVAGIGTFLVAAFATIAVIR